MSMDRNCVLLGESLLWEVDRAAKRDRRTRLQEIDHLCDVALKSQKPAKPTPHALKDDGPKTGRTTIPATLTERVAVRTKRTGESTSAAVRALVASGLAIEEERHHGDN